METAADLLYDLPKEFPLFFDCVHFIFCLQGERADIGEQYRITSRRFPLACWLSSMMTCFAGGLLAAPLCGEPILSALLDDPTRLALATVLWYLTFFSPKDLFYNLIGQTYAKVPLGVVKGLYYPKKIAAGLKHAKHIFKGSPLCGVAVAVLKGNGSGIIKPLARLARGRWTPDAFESMRPSVTTKLCFCCAVIYLSFPTALAYVIMCGLFVAMKVGPPLGFPFDPFTKLENAVGPIFFGDPHAKAD